MLFSLTIFIFTCFSLKDNGSVKKGSLDSENIISFSVISKDPYKEMVIGSRGLRKLPSRWFYSDGNGANLG